MNHGVRFGLPVLATLLLGVPGAACACAPTELVRIVYRNVSPGVAAMDASAQPRTLWRKGPSFLRSEEQPDPAGGGQALIVVSEPDIWVINLATRTGRHSIDPDPTLEVHAPIIPLADAPPVFQTLEYGCEARFVADHAPQPKAKVAWGDRPAQLHVATFGDHSLAMLMDAKQGSPLMISYIRQGRPVLVVRYDDYRVGLPERPNLFRPPGGVKIQEGPPETVIRR